VAALAVGGYVVANWGFVLSHANGAWHLRRGLLTTRETSLDDERLAGVSVAEPLALRLAGGGRVSAIVTGLGRRHQGSALLVPPAPRPVVLRVAGIVLGTAGPVLAPLTGHGPRARRRRFTRALAPALLVLVATLLLLLLADAPAWLLPVAALGIPAAVVLAADRAGGLGHALVEGHLVARSGSLNRHRHALATEDVIGWTFRSSWFQRRAGLTSLAATTAGGQQAVTVLDVPEPAAVGLATAATPGLVEQFIA
jgi:putative membrane protein